MRAEHLSENVKLILGDCREVLPTLRRPAAIICDPPYGQNLKTSITRKTPGLWKGNSNWPKIAGDHVAFDPSPLLDKADVVLLWGWHQFGQRLPGGSLLVWDKVPTGKIKDQGDGEIAWLNANPPRPLRIYRLLWDGLCVGSAARLEVGSKRVHPTQKPVSLMSWCIAQARVPAGRTICDPYMGAGSTGVAAVRAGHGFVGIEIEPLYFDTACRRIADALSRPDMFVEAAREAATA